jgi:hypothetical protein
MKSLVVAIAILIGCSGIAQAAGDKDNVAGGPFFLKQERVTHCSDPNALGIAADPEGPTKFGMVDFTRMVIAGNCIAEMGGQRVYVIQAAKMRADGTEVAWVLNANNADRSIYTRHQLWVRLQDMVNANGESLIGVR